MTKMKLDGNTYQGWIKAFQIFAKYKPNQISPVQPAHDIVYSGCDPLLVSDEDKAILDELGWGVEDQYECFYKFT